MTQIPASDSAIVAAFWWNDTRGDIATKLHTTRGHVTRVWAKAKAGGNLPNLTRPPKGFDLRADAMAIARLLFPQSPLIPHGTAREPEYAHGKTRSEHAGSSS